MNTFYTNEQNIQMVIFLLKQNNIRNVIASPGGTNVSFVASIQQDPFFKIYSCVDERSAAYMACGLAAELKQPVVLSCTGATASRNYVPGLTEAYYRKLPILAITSSQVESHYGNLHPQAIDRRVIQNDIANISVNVRVIKDSDDEFFDTVNINKAIHYLKKNGGGPVHINLETIYSDVYDVKELPKYRNIEYYDCESDFPSLKDKKIGIFIGSHLPWTKEEELCIEQFCSTYNSFVIGDHTSNYKGKFFCQYSLLGTQELYDRTSFQIDVLLHIGEISGDYYLNKIPFKEVWRINQDGEIRDYFRKLTKVFDCSEKFFFNNYLNENISNTTNLVADQINREYDRLYSLIPELPFSNLYIAKKLSQLLPKSCNMHFGILNSLRSWNMFRIDPSIRGFSNVGGFGIDGCISSIIGSCLAAPNKINIIVLGDLAFFYDFNSLGNYNILPNLRILLVNNGLGVEFKNYNGLGDLFGKDANKFIAAEGHFGSKSAKLVKNYSENLGFQYISANNKQEFEDNIDIFINPNISNKPILFEVFTTEEDENLALKLVRTLDPDKKIELKSGIKKILGDTNVKKIKQILGK